MNIFKNKFKIDLDKINIFFYFLYMCPILFTLKIKCAESTKATFAKMSLFLG